MQQKQEADNKLEYQLGHVEAEKLRDAEKAFLARPRLSIRLRIVAGFLLCFFLLAVTGVINLAILYQARSKLHFLDISQDLSLDVQQSRHFALMDFPNKSNLNRAGSYAKKAADLLMGNGSNVLSATGEKNLSELNFTLGHYVQSLDDSLPLAEENGSINAIKRKNLRETLDGDSVTILNKLRSLKSRAAAEADHVLKISQTLPFIFSAVMLIIIFWITSLIAGTITTSLERLQRFTHRIASGNFKLMNPRRRYHDEFSDLALAVNRMLLELRTREAQVLRADRLANIGAFAEGMADELNAALDSISGMARTFVEGCQSPDEFPHYNLIQDIVSETETVKQTVEELLAFTGDDRFKPEPLDLHGLVESARRLLKNKMTKERVDFKNEVPSDLPSVLGSFNQLKHVLLNLFQNAIQAMPQGGLLEVKASLLEGHRIEVTVADEGVGIPPEDLDHVFDPLYTTKVGTKGMGLGLSISYTIMQKHGGDIRVVSLVGQGTTVHLTLALAE